MAEKPPRKSPAMGFPIVPTMGSDWDQPTDVREMMRAQAKELAAAAAEEEAKRAAEEKARRQELQLSALFGIDGRPGIIETMEAKQTATDARLEGHDKILGALVEFKGRVIWLASGAVALGGFAAVLIVKAAEKFLGL